MKTLIFSILLLLFNSSLLLSQIAINNDGSAPDASSALDISYTTKGFLLPRMTQSQIETISTPANGLQVFCTSDSKIYIYVALTGQWKEIAYGSGTISPPFTCGMNLTIHHVAGNIAPGTKILTYGTVANIPGEPSKCWITSNLGADRKATAKDDATEGSAGWYWQFNRIQGYKHDGTTVTPIWTTTTIDENSDWISSNDPCALELGSSWRLPTYTEWFNVNLVGDWTDWNGPWNSALKLHTAGYLEKSNGSLMNRGSEGYYFSSTQAEYYINATGYYLTFSTGGCGVTWAWKAYGFSVRCLLE